MTLPAERNPVTLERAPHTAWRRLGDETVVINLATRRMLSLNTSGSRIWEALASGADLRALAALLPSRPGAAEQLTEFVAELEREGLLCRADSPPPETPQVVGGEVVEIQPLAGFTPPRITWSEDLLRFGGACGKIPGGGGPCIGAPQRS